jgi:2-polyprenyl-3-methyl-5-hydroxy-6-metoxy-1,4-benzoquinol methylase
MKYIHEETVHNLKDPEIIIPKILEIISPKSVVDIGCGVGTFLNVFNRYGISNLMGLDGHWVDKSLLLKNIMANQFRGN